MHLRSKLYSTKDICPRNVLTPVHFDNKKQYPFAEGMLDDSKTQAYVHDCTVHVCEGPYVYRYRVFFKRHSLLDVNATIASIAQNSVAPFRRDILVMQLSIKNDTYVHLCKQDTILANFLVKE